MAILRESTNIVECITEETETGKQLYIVGPMAQYDVVNRNKRFYPKSVLENSVNIYRNDFMARNMAAGELNHPNHLEIDPERIAARVCEIWDQDGKYFGKSLVVDTPCGNIVKGLVAGGFQMGVSTRASGSLKESTSGVSIVQPDLRLVAFDIVTTPSGPDCYVQGIMESASPFWNTIEEYADANLIESFQKEMKGMSVKQINEKKFELFQKFVEAIKVK